MWEYPFGGTRGQLNTWMHTGQEPQLSRAIGIQQCIHIAVPPSPSCLGILDVHSDIHKMSMQTGSIERQQEVELITCTAFGPELTCSLYLISQPNHQLERQSRPCICVLTNKTGDIPTHLTDLKVQEHSHTSLGVYRSRHHHTHILHYRSTEE